MLFNEIDNFIEVYYNLYSVLGPRKLSDQIPTKELGPKTLYSFNNLSI